MNIINKRLTTNVRSFSLVLLMGLALILSNTARAGSLICEIEIESDEEHEYGASTRVVEELSFETYRYDPALESTWLDLFAVMPGVSADDAVVLQGSNRTVTWPEGVLRMSGLMKIKVKTDSHSGLKEIKIKQVDSDDGVTYYDSGTGGVNAQAADAGWHEVEVENMNNVTVIIDGVSVTGFLKELEVELDESSVVGSPVVEEFELKIKASTSLPDVKKGFVSSVVVHVPATTIVAVGGVSYEEEMDEGPVVLGGHVEAEYEREEGSLTEGVLIDGLLDGFNDVLEEREGPCDVGLGHGTTPPAGGGTTPPASGGTTPPAGGGRGGPVTG